MRDLFWVAYYHDDSCLHQFENEKEHLFKDIDQERLKAFKVVYLGKEYVVRISDGKLFINGIIFSFDGFDNENEYDLIYFVHNKRHIRVFDGKSKLVGSERYPHIGWKTKEKNASVKRMIMLMPDGEVVIKDK